MSALSSLHFGPEPESACASLVWLHGLGACADDFRDLASRLAIPGLRVILPQAPQRPVTLFGGQVAPAWCDLAPGPGGTIESDPESLEESAAAIHELLREERRGGVSSVVLGGYSQGGATALYAALTNSQPPACAVSLSGYVPAHESMGGALHEKARDVALFLAHGNHDEVVPPVYGTMSRDWLGDRGFRVEWYEGDFGHEVTDEELAALADFLRRSLSIPQTS